MNNRFVCLTDWIEWLCSTWWGFSIYCLGALLTYQLWGWDGIDRYTYLTNAVLVVMLLNNQRRDSKAAQIKLDEVDPEDHEGLENKSEEEIEATRKKIADS